MCGQAGDRELDFQDKHGGQLLHCAAQGGSIAIVQRLLDAGADLSARTADADRTCLHYAAHGAVLTVHHSTCLNGSKLQSHAIRWWMLPG